MKTSVLCHAIFSVDEIGRYMTENQKAHFTETC